MSGNPQIIPANRAKAVVIVIRCEVCGKYLGISRKDDYQSFGLIGGKVDLDDLTPESAARRELWEETGLIAEHLILGDKRVWDNRLVYYYLATEVSEFLVSNKQLVKQGEGIAKWVDQSALFEGFFKDYNTVVIPEMEQRFPDVKSIGVRCDEH
jgi:8-oxo-dGTP pyrophosphatase MutT (NUDIX family)